MKLFYSVVVFTLFMTGCVSFHGDKSESRALIFAHGGSVDGANYNSRAAIAESLANPHIDGIELDVVLTKDLVPVIAHDPWLDKQHCYRVDSSKMDYVLIKDILFDELVRLYQCSYPSPHSAQKQFDSLMPLSEVLTILTTLEAKRSLSLYLDMKIETDLTLSGEQYAQAISGVISDNDLSNPLYIELPTATAVKLFDRHLAKDRYTSVISYPAFYAEEDWNLVGARHALKTILQPASAKKLAVYAGADMIMSPTIVMSKKAVQELKKQEIQYGTFLIEDKISYKKACEYSADLMIVDYIYLLPSGQCALD